jgi:hypothetical protein
MAARNDVLLPGKPQEPGRRGRIPRTPFVTAYSAIIPVICKEKIVSGKAGIGLWLMNAPGVSWARRIRATTGPKSRLGKIIIVA